MLQEKTKMENGNENFELSQSDFLRTPPSSQSDYSQTNHSSYDFNATNQFELSPGDFQTSISTLSDRTYSSSQSQSNYEREQEHSYNNQYEYGHHRDDSWTTSTEPYNGKFCSSYYLSTDTPLSTANYSRENNSESSIYHTANTHFSSSQASSHVDHFRYPWEMSLSEFPNDPISASTSYYNEPNMHRARSSFGTYDDIAGNNNSNDVEYLYEIKQYDKQYEAEIKDEPEERY